MKINYTLSAIMKLAHSIAKGLNLDIYKQALSRGLKKAWAIAKGIVEIEEGETACEFVQNTVLFDHLVFSTQQNVLDYSHSPLN